MARNSKPQDLSPQEVYDAFAELRRQMGARAYVSAGLDLGRCQRDKVTFSAHLWPKDLTGSGPQLSASGSSWRELVENARAAWEAHTGLHAANTIREMALKIIAITADLGECTDSALRAEFDAADVARFGDQACEAATAMASNGPFSIVRLSSANDHAEAA